MTTQGPCNIAIIGVGGVGSWLMFQINDLIKHGQFSDGYRFYMYDDDEVVDKNIRYQYFRDHEIFDKKTDALAQHFGCPRIISNPTKVTNMATLNDFPILVSCVDNNSFREMFFKYVFSSSKVEYWLDLRSEGTTIFAQQKHPSLTLEQVMKTIDINNKASMSCQREWELKNHIIQQGNKIVSVIGSQWLLNHTRGVKPVRASYTATF